MNKFINLETIEAEIVNIEYNIGLVNTNLARSESDVTLLTHLQARIEENINAMKTNGVPLITEFKKARDDLEKVRVNLISVRNNRDVFNKNIKTLQDSLEKCKNRKTLALKFKECKVIYGNFGSKNGRQD